MKCPICGFEAKTFVGLQVHALRTHKLRECPVCSKPMKHMLTHLAKMAKRCKKHALVYALYSGTTKTKSPTMRKLYKEIVDYYIQQDSKTP